VLILETAHRAGALVAALQPFADRGINLTRIESRPGDRVWSYRFFLELVTGGGTQDLDAAVADVRAHGGNVMLLGVFPESRNPTSG
jgi:prephenate dehydratase